MRNDLLVQFLSGALVAGYAVVGLFFLRFWRETRDRLFAFFSVAFFILAVQRTLVVMTESSTAVYLVRLTAFVLILWAIYDKNRSH